MLSEVEPVREAAAGEFCDEGEEDQRRARESPLMPTCSFHGPPKVCAPWVAQVKSETAGSDPFGDRSRADDGDHPLVGAAILEGDEEDSLVLAEVEAAVRERDLLGPRPQQE